jgi:lipoate-protein ligase A
MKNPKEVIYLNPLELNGPEQMAIDLFLLEKSFTEKNFHMAIRFYTWDGDWLSIGKNQKEIPAIWLNLLKNKKLKMVRRPSGGKAVLHSKGLTYALIWKYPPKSKKESYLKTTEWLKDGFKKAGVDLFLGDKPVDISNSNCFATSTLADLVDKDKNKQIGSAQYWKKGHLLQHGEILIEPSKKLWKKVFNSDPPEIKKELKKKDRIIFLLKESFIQTWPNLKWSEYKLEKKDQELIKLLAKDNFRKETHF